MNKFKCDKCRCHPEELWMFGFSKDENEYCEKCFNLLEGCSGLHTQELKASLEQKEIENNPTS